jgi:hypothetical protein
LLFNHSNFFRACSQRGTSTHILANHILHISVALFDALINKSDTQTTHDKIRSSINDAESDIISIPALTQSQTVIHL